MIQADGPSILELVSDEDVDTLQYLGWEGEEEHLYSECFGAEMVDCYDVLGAEMVDCYDILGADMEEAAPMPYFLSCGKLIEEQDFNGIGTQFFINHLPFYVLMFVSYLKLNCYM